MRVAGPAATLCHTSAMAASDSTFLGSITDEARATLGSLGTWQILRPRQPVLLQGERARRLAVVHRGLVKVEAAERGGRPSVLAIRGPGELVGELAVLDGEPRSASAITLRASEVQFVTEAEFLQLVRAHPEIGLVIIRMLAARLREADLARIHMTEAVPTRLARALLELASDSAELAQEGPVTVRLPITQDELASMLASSRDAVAKALRTWRDQGLITTGRGTITLLDPAALSRRQLL